MSSFNLFNEMVPGVSFSLPSKIFIILKNTLTFANHIDLCGYNPEFDS